jgi:phenylalanyl-tRNA synthetase beta chain
MNILIPHNWLLEHLETDASPTEIQKYLSLCGPSIERIYDREGDYVYDIEVTTNRVDSFSVRGIAREAAVILQQFGIPAKLKPLSIDQSLYSKNSSFAELKLPTINNNPTLNKRTICIILQNVKRSPTPEWMAKRLRQVEMNVHDSIIDITNYVTHELGHPCHAFDYDKLMATGGEINIVEASKGEAFVTLDGESFETVGGEVVFKNGQNEIIDLPSIKGTKNTSIDESTKNVLLLLESIVADKVRFSSMTHAIRTTAAQLMEKNVDPILAEVVLKKGTELYLQLCDAQIGSQIYDDFSGKTLPSKIEIKQSTISQYLGLEIELNKIEQILQDLGCEVIIDGQNLSVITPTFRPDLQIPADIVEEIARIYGYHNLPSVVMPTRIPLSQPQDITFDLETKIKHFLADIGWQEIYSYSLVSEKLALQSGYELSAHLKIQNPLTDDKVFLRRSLIPSLVEVIEANPMSKSLSVFEVANLYPPQNASIPLTSTNLTLVSNKPYRQIRGEIEALFGKLYISDWSIQPIEVAAKPFIQQAEIIIDDKRVGLIGNLEQNLIATTFEIKILKSVAKKHPQYQPISKTTSLIEDLTFTLPESIQIGKVLAAIKSFNPLINQVELADIYKQNFTFNISYLNRETNLTSQDVEPIRKAIIEMIRQQFHGELVGTV